MKRFTDTSKWRDPWYRMLTTTQKCLWLLICDYCDHAGVFEFDENLCSLDIGSKVKMSDLEAFGDRVRHLYGKKWLIVKFIAFQYGKLSPECKPHRPVYAALEKHQLSADELIQNTRYRGLVDPYLRDKIIARDGGKCVYTGKVLLPSEIAIDHVQPRSKGGATKAHNLVCMDSKLNHLKSDLTLDEFCSVAGLDIQDVRERLSKSLSKSINTLQEQEEEKDKEKEQDKDKDTLSANKAKATREELDQFCRENGLFPRDSEYLWARWEGNGWINNKTKIKNWRMTVRSWKAQRYLPSQKQRLDTDYWPSDEPEQPTEESELENPINRLFQTIKTLAEKKPEPEPVIEPMETGELF